MAAFVTTNATKVLSLLDMSGTVGVSITAKNPTMKAKASTGDNDAIRGSADQFRTSELHIGTSAGGLAITSTTGTDVATFKDAGDHNIGATNQTVTFPGSVTITQNLTVSGTTTTVSTTNLVISDSLMGLSNGATSETNDAGLHVTRGTGNTNAVFVWDKSATAWHAGTVTEATTAAATGDLTITDAALQSGAITTSGNFSQTGSTTFSTGTSTFTHNGAVVFASVATTASGTSSFDLSGGSGIFKTTTGAVTIGNGAVSVTGASTFSADITLSGNRTINGTGTITWTQSTTGTGTAGVGWTLTAGQGGVGANGTDHATTPTVGATAAAGGTITDTAGKGGTGGNGGAYTGANGTGAAGGVGGVGALVLFKGGPGGTGGAGGTSAGTGANSNGGAGGAAGGLELQGGAAGTGGAAGSGGSGAAGSAGAAGAAGDITIGATATRGIGIGAAAPSTAGQITITAAAASTWSTSTGILTVKSASDLVFQATGANTVATLTSASFVVAGASEAPIGITDGNTLLSSVAKNSSAAISTGISAIDAVVDNSAGTSQTSGAGASIGVSATLTGKSTDSSAAKYTAFAAATPTTSGGSAVFTGLLIASGFTTDISLIDASAVITHSGATSLTVSSTSGALSLSAGASSTWQVTGVLTMQGSTGVRVNASASGTVDLQTTGTTQLSVSSTTVTLTSGISLAMAGASTLTVGTAGITAVSGSRLDLGSTTVAPKVASMTTTQRDALTAVDGMIIFNSTTAQFEGYDSTWQALGSGGAVSGTDNIEFKVNQDAAAGTDEDPYLTLAGGDGGTEIVETILRQDSTADKAYLFQHLSTVADNKADRSSELVIGPIGEANATGNDLDATLRFRAHFATDVTTTFKEATAVLDASASDWVFTAPASFAISAASNLDAEAGLDVTGGALTVGTGGSYSQTVGTFSFSVAASFTVNTGASNVDIDLTTGAFTVDTTTSGGISLDSQAASNFTVTGAALTLSTATSGTLSLTSAGILTITGAAASTWSLSTGALIVRTATANALTIQSGTADDAGNIINFQSGSAVRLSVDDDSVNFVVNPLPSADNARDIGSGSLRWRDFYLYGSYVTRATGANHTTDPAGTGRVSGQAAAGDVVSVADDTGTGKLQQSDATANNGRARALGVYGGTAGMVAGPGSVRAVNKRPLRSDGTLFETLVSGDIVHVTVNDFAYSDEGSPAPTAANKKGTASKATSTTVGDVIHELGVVTADSSNTTATVTIVVMPRFSQVV